MKAWYQSKTVWLNLVTFLSLALVMFAPGSQFADLVSPLASRWFELGVALVNIVLRVYFTVEPIGNAKG